MSTLAETANLQLPNLRFKEFESFHSEFVFEKVAKVIDCKHRTPPYVDSGIPVISPGTIKWGKIDLETPTKRVTETEYSTLMDHCSPSIGDLVFSRNQSIGIASIIDSNRKFVLGQDTVLIQSKNVDSEYLYYSLQTKTLQNQILSLAGGSTFSRINLRDLRKLKLKITENILEQKKIASFLSAVDKRIDLLEQKKAKLEEYKKGVMQRIFSRDVRFKDENGKEFPEWNKRKLGDILNYEQPTKYLVDSTEYEDEFETPVLTAGKTFILGYTNETEGIFTKLPVIIFDDFTTAFKYVDFPFKAKSSAMKMLIPNSKEVNLKFVYEAMGRIKFPLAEHKRYWISEFQYMKIHYPCIEEQNKIADFLTSIDNKIEMVEQQIEGTNHLKKGLLQQMFV